MSGTGSEQARDRQGRVPGTTSDQTHRLPDSSLAPCAGYCCAYCSSGYLEFVEPTPADAGRPGGSVEQGRAIEPPTHDGPCVESLDGDGIRLGYCVTCYQPTGRDGAPHGCECDQCQFGYTHRCESATARRRRNPDTDAPRRD